MAKKKYYTIYGKENGEYHTALINAESPQKVFDHIYNWKFVRGFDYEYDNLKSEFKGIKQDQIGGVSKAKSTYGGYVYTGEDEQEVKSVWAKQQGGSAKKGPLPIVKHYAIWGNIKFKNDPYQKEMYRSESELKDATDAVSALVNVLKVQFGFDNVNEKNIRYQKEGESLFYRNKRGDYVVVGETEAEAEKFWKKMVKPLKITPAGQRKNIQYRRRGSMREGRILLRDLL